MNNSKKRLIIAIAVVALAVVFIVGSTYAFFQWRSDNSARTTVNFVISRPNMTIAGINVTSSSLVPTTDCASTAYAVRGNASVVVTNNTGTPMRAVITLKGKLTPVSGRTLSEADKGHIHWAIKEVASATTSYATANCNSTANTASYAAGTFAGIGSTYSDIATTITYDIAANQTTVTKYYQVYVWIDSSYVYTTVGSTAADPTQGLTVNLTFSESSYITQDLSTYIYTISTTSASIGQAPPTSNYVTYTNKVDAASAGIVWSGEPFYLKHKIENDIITESYVEIYENGLIYTLRGGVNESSLASKPIYDANMAVKNNYNGTKYLNVSNNGTVYISFPSGLTKVCLIDSGKSHCFNDKGGAF